MILCISNSLKNWLYRTTVCIEDCDIELCDGTTKLFLSTKGTEKDIPKQLKAFSNYVDGSEPTDDLLEEIERILI